MLHESPKNEHGHRKFIGYGMMSISVIQKKYGVAYEVEIDSCLRVDWSQSELAESFYRAE